VLAPAGGTDSIPLGVGLVRDLAVQADLLCEFRPELAGDGFERIGVFARDRAQGAFDGTRSQAGACYALTWDSHDGRVRCLRAAGGALTDLAPAPVLRTGTAWRRFRIEVRGSVLSFALDGVPLAEVVDATHPDGELGIGYHEYFLTDAHARGTRADAFFADVPGAFAFALAPGPAAGELHFANARGVPRDVYLTALTLAPGAFPNGWFFGLDPSLGDLLGLVGTGHPAFLGRLDADGRSDVAVRGLPPGVGLWGVSLDLDPGFQIVRPSRPVAAVTR
jgi:hypothetical protein